MRAHLLRFLRVAFLSFVVALLLAPPTASADPPAPATPAAPAPCAAAKTPAQPGDASDGRAAAHARGLSKTKAIVEGLETKSSEVLRVPSYELEKIRGARRALGQDFVVKGRTLASELTSTANALTSDYYFPDEKDRRVLADALLDSIDNGALTVEWVPNYGGGNQMVADWKSMVNDRSWRDGNALPEWLQRTQASGALVAGTQAELQKARDLTWKSLLTYASTTQDAAMREKIYRSAAKHFGYVEPKFAPADELRAAMNEALKYAYNEPLRQLVAALKARRLADTKAFAGYVAPAAELDKKIDGLLKDPEVMAAFQRERAAAVKRMAASREYEAYRAFVNSWEFTLKVRTLPREQANELLLATATKLALVDRAAGEKFLVDQVGEEAAAALLARSDVAFAEGLVALETAMGGKQKGDALRDFLFEKKDLKGAKMGVDLTRQGGKLVGALREVITRRGPDARNAAAALTEYKAFANSEVGKSLGDFFADKTGKLGSAGASLGLAMTLLDLKDGKLGGDGNGHLTSEDVSAIRSVLKAGGQADSYGKLFGTIFAGGPKALDGTKFMRAAKFAKVLGPAADAFGAWNAVENASKSAAESNDANAAWHNAAAFGYGMSSVGGLLVMTGHPVAVLVGTFLVIGGMTTSAVSEAVVGKDFVRAEEGETVADIKMSGILVPPSKEVTKWLELKKKKDRLEARLEELRTYYIASSPLSVLEDRDAKWKRERDWSDTKDKFHADIAALDKEMKPLEATFKKQGIDPKVWDGYHEFTTNRAEAKAKAERPDPATQPNYGQIRKYAGSLTSDRRYTPGPVGDAARRMLDDDKGFKLRDPSELVPSKPMTPEQLLRGALHTTPFETATLKRNPDWYTKHKVSPGSCAQCH